MNCASRQPAICNPDTRALLDPSGAPALSIPETGLPMTRVALFGGLYSNYLALEAALHDARRRGVDGVYCLGDLGAFGPYPDRVFPLLMDHRVECVQGNYDNSIGNELADCQCGYTDPRDNYFAQRSYDYTLAHTTADNRRWLLQLPQQIRFELGQLARAQE